MHLFTYVFIHSTNIYLLSARFCAQDSWKYAQEPCFVLFNVSPREMLCSTTLILGSIIFFFLCNISKIRLLYISDLLYISGAFTGDFYFSEVQK